MELFDLHSDLLTSGLTPERACRALHRAYRDGLKAVRLAIWTTEMVCSFAQLERMVRDFSNHATCCDEARPRFLYSIEDLHFLEREDLQRFVKCPFDAAGLTWNYDNRLAGGACGDGGLTALGRDTLAIMADNGVILDTAHLNRKSFFQCLEAFEGKVMCSHTCLDRVRSHRRNLTDAQVAALIARGGVMGLCFVGDFLSDSGKADSDAVIRHIDAYCEAFSHESLCIGTDFYGTHNLPQDIKNYKNVAILLEKLKRLGYNDMVMQDITYRNHDRFLKGV